MRIGDLLPLFGGNIRYLRMLCGLSQRSLVKLVGVSAREIKKLEDASGTVHVDYRIFVRLLAVFGVDATVATERDLQKENYMLRVYTIKRFPAVYEDTKPLE